MDKASAQKLMDTISDAVIAGDHDTYLANIDVPYVLVSSAKTQVLADPDKIRDGILAISNMYATLRIATVARVVDQVVMLGGENCIVHYSVSLLTMGGGRHCDPYPGATSIRKRADGTWCATMTFDSLKTDNWPVLSPVPNLENK